LEDDPIFRLDGEQHIFLSQIKINAISSSLLFKEIWVTFNRRREKYGIWEDNLSSTPICSFSLNLADLDVG
jgi:hypothetical protein